jgi:lactoylglutathione lyase
VSIQPCNGIAQIERIALATNDLETLCAFYRRLGGIASPLSIGSDGDLRACALDFCGIRLELFERQPPRLLHLGFALGSADAVDELSLGLAAAGYRMPEQPHRARGSGRYESVVLDPDGNRLRLSV